MLIVRNIIGQGRKKQNEKVTHMGGRPITWFSIVLSLKKQDRNVRLVKRALPTANGCQGVFILIVSNDQYQAQNNLPKLD